MNPDRTDEFVPLVAAAPAGGSREFQITVIPQNGHAQPFQTLGNRTASVPSAKNGEPQLTVQRDGNRITHIRVQCNCGQSHEIACVYEEPGDLNKPATPEKAVDPEKSLEPEKIPKPEKSTKSTKSTKSKR